MLKIFDGSKWILTDQQQNDTTYYSALPPENTSWNWYDTSEDENS